jgi:hypothetical protein
MRLRLSVILPILGLVLFAAVSYRSMAVNHHEQEAPRKYYSWSTLRLDSDPLNKNPAFGFDTPPNKKIAPGWLDRVLVLSALPAFLVDTAVVVGLSKLGIDEVLTFMVSTPVLLFAWYYFCGWLIERWIFRRKRSRNIEFKVT